MDGKIKLRQGTRFGIFKQIDTEVCLKEKRNRTKKEKCFKNYRLI